ncbi:hypothetical protein [Sphingobacterium sp. BIGb0116]|uniref:hypothetical protein n=1 Tax=Sphingobacterium sp. BIGb0116 TaxID=2940619 RepID=UPI0021671F0C|nr:hypothetical protein [Sphingobacterium sp. BIGb0116]MCS4168541.1 hypothetical protein [Sphingobacterium sp. BIGb0116]
MNNLSALEIDRLKGNDPIYAGVELLGYYEKGDTPAPIIYYLAPTGEDPGPNDDGSIVEINGNKLVHKFEEIDPLYFGAKGDGISDDAEIIEKVLRKGLRVRNSKNTFLLKRAISVTSIKIDIDCLNLKLDVNPIGKPYITFNESSIKNGRIVNTVNINELSTSLLLDDTSGINVGDLMVIRCIPQTSGNILVGRNYVIKSAGGNFTAVGAPDNNIGTSFKATAAVPDYGAGGSLLILWDFDPRPGETDVTLGETHRIIAVTDNRVTLDVPIMTLFSSSFNMSYGIYRPKEFRINNLSLFADSTGLFGGLSVSYKTGEITSCRFSKVSGLAGISVNTCYSLNIENTHIIDGYYDGTATSYGIQDNGSTRVTIMNSFFSNNRRAVDFSGVIPSHLGTVRSCKVSSNIASNYSGSCLGSHGGADLTTFDSNTCIGGIIGIQLRGGRANIRNNLFIGNLITCISISFSNSVTIEKNQVSYNRDYTNQTPAFFVQTNNTTTFNKYKPLIIKDNSLNEIRTAVIGYNTSENIIVEGIQLINNNVVLRSNIATNKVGLIVNQSGGLFTLRRSIIKDNCINTLLGVYSDVVGGLIDNVYNYGDISRALLSSDVVKWTGTGNISGISVNAIQQNINNRNNTVKGSITFTVSGGSAGIKIQGFLRPFQNVIDLYSHEGHSMMMSTIGELYIGHELGDNYSTLFPDGTYTVNFDLNYSLNPSYTY